MMNRPAFLFAIACCLCMTSCGDDQSAHSNPGGGNPGGGNPGGGSVVDPDNPGGGQGNPGTNPGDETECEPGETQCDGYSLLTCNKFGQFDSEPCGSKELCFDTAEGSRCMTQAEYDELNAEKDCTFGDTMCDEEVVNALVTCTEEGKWGEPRDCGINDQVCGIGDSGVAACLNPPPPRECDSGVTRCVEDTIQICSDSGQFSDLTNCALQDPPQSCELVDSAATCVTACTEGLKRCAFDGQVETCTEGVYVAAPCPDENTICGVVGDETQCVPKPECVTGETQCDEDDLKTCIDGFWQTGPCPGELKCRVDETSQIAACTVIPCTEGATYCGAANTLYTCISGDWVSKSCIKDMNPVHICDQNGNTAATGDHDKAGCVEPTVSGGGDTVLDTDGDTIPDTVEGRAPTNSRDTDGDTIPDYLDLDSDGDTIPDSVEANNGGNIAIPPDDSDYDGKPNYIDEDSDDNGIPDSLEACPSGKNCQVTDMASGKDASGNELSTKFSAVMVPFNSNPTGGDVPDYLDYDNDGDGYSDKDEIRGLVGTPNPGASKFSGECNGGSLALGAYGNQGTANRPLDCDGDTVPDYMDTDSDGDGLSDAFEGMTMKLGFYARYSKDIDQDGLQDKAECLPYKADGTCRDSDGDGVPDMLEVDSDGDGLSDKEETVLGSDPTKTDSDNDKAPDIVEYAICVERNGGSPVTSCPAMSNPGVNPQDEGNFVFVTPYKAASSDSQTLSLETSIQTIDLFFTFDSSASMPEEIESLKTSLPTMLANLQCHDHGVECEENADCASIPNTICSERKHCITNPSYGDGCFDDMWTGLGFYGNADTFWVSSHLSNNSQPIVDMLQVFVDDYYKGKAKWVFDYFNKDGTTETPYQAPICAVLGNTDKSGDTITATTLCHYSSKRNCTQDKTKVGCVGFRPNAIRVNLQAFDENNCTEGTSNTTQKRCKLYRTKVGGILSDNKVRFIGLWSGGSSMKTVSDNICTSSHSVDSSNNPFSYEALNSELAAKAAKGVRDIASLMPMDITATVVDIDANALKLIKELKINQSGDSVHGKSCYVVPSDKLVVGKTTDESGVFKYDGVNALLPGNLLCYDVVPVQNQTIFPALSTVQVKKARVKVIGDGSTLNSGIAYFVIPPATEGTNM